MSITPKSVFLTIKYNKDTKNLNCVCGKNLGLIKEDIVVGKCGNGISRSCFDKLSNDKDVFDNPFEESQKFILDKIIKYENLEEKLSSFLIK